MANAYFLHKFNEHIPKGLGDLLAGPPSIFQGGVAVDHYRGLSNTLKTELVPFYKESYQATEYLYGWIPIRDPTVPLLYFQASVLGIKEHSIPGAVHFAAPVAAPIPETIVTQMIVLTNRYLPLNALEGGKVTPREALKQKLGWTPLLEALNTDKAAEKAGGTLITSARMGKYVVKLDSGSPIGLTQLAPYKGSTILTAQHVPSVKADVDAPDYDMKEIVKKFQVIGGLVVRHPQRGQEVGEQILLESNQAMMDLLFRQLDTAGAGARAAPRQRRRTGKRAAMRRPRPCPARSAGSRCAAGSASAPSASRSSCGSKARLQRRRAPPLEEPGYVQLSFRTSPERSSGGGGSTSGNRGTPLGSSQLVG